VRGGLPALERGALEGVRLPESLQDDLRTLRRDDPQRYRHALATAVVSVRMVLAAVGRARALPELAAAGLLHDLGMRHVPARVALGDAPLEQGDVLDVASHPLLGAWQLAAALGIHPAVEAALAHHWRSGHGYPSLPRPPSRSVEIVAVASAYCALTQPRAYRSHAYDARGAADVLVGEAKSAQADLGTVRLLVYALRGGSGALRDVRFARERLGHAPAVNWHTLIAPTQNAV